MDNPDLLPVGADPQSASAQRVEKLAAHTPPEPVKLIDEVRHYSCTIPNASIHRKDGTRIGFIFGHFMTQNEPDIKFLDSEIKNGHPYICHATEQEISAAMMKKDPRGTIKKELEGEVKQQLEQQLMSQLAAKLGLDQKDLSALINSQVEDLSATTESADKLAGTEQLKSLKDRFRSGAATITPVQPAVPLIKPVSTADIAAATVSSGK